MKKLSLFVMPLMAISLLASCGGGASKPDLYIKLTSSTCELREKIDSQGTNSIKIAYGSKNLDFYIFPTDDTKKNLSINSITTGDEDFSEHYSQLEDYHFVTDDTELTKDLVIDAEATEFFVVTFHANDGMYSDGTSTREIKDVKPGETFGEVTKRLKDKPVRTEYDSFEAWTDYNKAPISDDLEIEGNITVYADYLTYGCYALFDTLNEHIDKIGMSLIDGRYYCAFDPNGDFTFTFSFDKGYKLSQEEITVVDEAMQRNVPFTIYDNTIYISSSEIADHNLIIKVPNSDLIQYEVSKPSYSYLTIDDTDYEHPTIESGYKATLTFKEGYKIPNRNRVVVNIDGEPYNDFFWNVNDDNTINFEIPSGVIDGTLSYDVSSYELKVYGSIINDLEPSAKISGMSVTLISNDKEVEYSATTSTDANGNYVFAYVEDAASYSITIDLSTGVTTDEQWVTNQDTLTISSEEISEGVRKDFYVADYKKLTSQPLNITVNNNYSHYDISAYNGLATATYQDSHYEIELKKDYDPDLLLSCNLHRASSRSLGILDMPTTVVPVDMKTVGSNLDLGINSYKNYGETTSSDPKIVCRNARGGSNGCYLATSRKNNNFAFMIHSPSLKDGSTYRMAFTVDHAAKVLDNRTFIITFTTEGKILSIADGNGNSVKNPELIHIYAHEAEGASLAAVEIVTTTDFIKAQGIRITDDQNIYCTLQSERRKHYGEFPDSVFADPSTYPLLKADGKFE